MLIQIIDQNDQVDNPTAPTELSRLIQGYRLCAGTEGKSRNSIEIVVRSVGYLEDYLNSECKSTDAVSIGPTEIRAFIQYLQQKRRFSNHPMNHTQERGLSSHTIHCYVRSVRAFWSWLVWEELVERSPFEKIRMPKIKRKVIPALSEHQLSGLINVIDGSVATGYRDKVIVLTILDTALRVSELTSIELDKLWLEDGLIKVEGKGGKERLVPIGKTVQKMLWRYINAYRPEPDHPWHNWLFLTSHGQPLNKDRIDKIMSAYGKKAGITGVRCSPHTLRHTSAIRFLRNGGDVFSLQRMLGHANLQMTRHYCEVADIDVKRAHITASPVDNLNGVL